MKNTAETTQNWPEIVAKKDAKISELEALVKYYQEQLRLAKYRKFGAKSEKSAYDGFDQINIFNEVEATADETVPEPELKEVQRTYRKRPRLVNDNLPENLPVEIVTHDLKDDEKDCAVCGNSLHVMSEDKRRELVIIPAKVKIREHRTKVYACRCCEKNETSVPIVKAPLDNPVIKKSFASPEAIAHIMYQKFVMGVPLYRQEQDLNRRGIPLSRQTMSNWLLQATEDWLVPVYDELYARLLMHEVLHSDETSLQVLKEPGKTPQSKSSIWHYGTGGDAAFPIALYEYQPDKKAKRPAEFLNGFKGYLHTDGAPGYHTLHPDIIVVGCLAHARRKFTDGLKSLPQSERGKSKLAVGKAYLDKLFDLEQVFKDLTPQERYKERQKCPKKILGDFFAWCEKHSHMTQTPLGKAVHYALNQRVYLNGYLLDGRLEASNNRAERSIKPFVINRKNFLFANTPRGAQASAVMTSIIETAKENGVDPYKYLVHIFKTAPNLDFEADKELLERLLPEGFSQFDGLTDAQLTS